MPTPDRPTQPPSLSPADPRLPEVIRLLEEEEARLVALRAKGTTGVAS